MKKYLFSILLFLAIDNVVLYALSDAVGIYYRFNKIGEGVLLSDTVFVTTDNVLRYSNFYLKDGKNIYYNYQIIFIDRISKLVFLKVKLDKKCVRLPKKIVLRETDNIYTMHGDKYVDIGFYTRKYKGYRALISDYPELYEGMPLYNTNHKFLGILIGNYGNNLYLFLDSEFLKFYKKHLKNILKYGKPVLKIVVEELWNKQGVKIVKSQNPLLKVNDIIIKLNHMAINNILDFNKGLFLVSKRNFFYLTIVRNKEVKRIKMRR